MAVKKLCKPIVAILLSIFMIMLVGCYDLGDFADDAEYYDSFGDITLIAQDKVKRDYSFETYFYNTESVNNFAGSLVEEKEYIYLVAPIKKTMKIDTFSLWLYGDATGTVSYALFLTDKIPSKIGAYDDPLYEQATDDDGKLLYNDDGTPKYKQKTDIDGNPITDENGNPVYVEIEYDDPKTDDAVAIGTYTVKNSWDSFTVETWNTSDGKKEELSVNVGQYFLLRFENNGIGGKTAGKAKVPFKTTNLMIRALWE